MSFKSSQFIWLFKWKARKHDTEIISSLSKTETGCPLYFQIWQKNVNMYFDKVNPANPCSIKGNVKYMCSKCLVCVTYNALKWGTFAFLWKWGLIIFFQVLVSSKYSETIRSFKFFYYTYLYVCILVYLQMPWGSCKAQGTTWTIWSLLPSCSKQSGT